MCMNTQRAIENEEKFIIPMPDYDEDATGLTKAIREKRVVRYSKRTDTLELNMNSSFIIIYVQCNEILRSKLEAVKGWTATKADNDPIGLIKAIKVLSHECDDNKYHMQ